MMQNVWNSSDMNKLSLPHYHKCTFEWLREFSYMYLTTLRKCYVNFRSRNRNWVVSVYKSVIYIIISLSFLSFSPFHGLIIKTESYVWWESRFWNTFFIRRWQVVVIKICNEFKYNKTKLWWRHIYMYV